MHFIALESETDFAGWRDAARTLVLDLVNPSEVRWTVQGDAAADTSGPSAAGRSPEAPHGTFSVPAQFIGLAQSAILHRDPSRFAMLYRLLWRLRSNHDLLDVIADPDVALVATMARAVQRDRRRMKGAVRFRETGREQTSHFIAWFEPAHHIVEATAAFFVRRFADMPWSILTPDICAHWDGHAVSFTPGLGKADAACEGRLEEIWLRYSAGIFNPAQLKAKARNPRGTGRRPRRLCLP